MAGRPFTTLVDLVTESTARTGAVYRPGRSGYPHMSLGYITDAAAGLDPVALRTALAQIERPLTGTVLVNRIHLVEQWHDSRRIHWNPLAEIPLGAAA